MRRLRLGRKASQRLENGHVWVYHKEVAAEVTAETCETALLADERGRLLGSAIVDGSAAVPIRLYSRNEQAFDAAWIQGRLDAAYEWRRRVVAEGNTGYRLVFSESDGLPGLVVDRFGGGAAVQIGMKNYTPFLPEIVSSLESEISRTQALDCVVLEQEGARRLLVGSGPETKALYLMNSLQFEADLMDGPKTGAFLDQRENYQAVANWAQRLGVSGRGLDLYSSSGGFAMHLARVMTQVEAVDSSEGAVTRITANAARNGIGNLRAIEADVKQYLRGVGQAKRRYDSVVADPPAFAKQVRQKEEATRAYYDLNVRALGAVAPSGLFVSCSCSRAISEADLLEIVRQSANESRKILTLLEKRSQPADHRTLLQIPETNYLKCLVFSVSS